MNKLNTIRVIYLLYLLYYTTLFYRIPIITEPYKWYIIANVKRTPYSNAHKKIRAVQNNTGNRSLSLSVYRVCSHVISEMVEKGKRKQTRV